jgi:hypothetical protein
VRRFLILSTVVVVVTLATVHGPAVYHWTPASERASRHEPFRGGSLDPDRDDLASIRQAYAEAAELYRQHRYREAEARFEAASRGSGEILAARSAYHRGNCLLASARQGRVDPELLRKAEGLYRDCLSREHKTQGAEALFEGARFNLELTRLLLAQSAPAIGTRGSIARDRGPSAPAPLAKLARSLPQVVVRSERGTDPRPAPAGITEPAWPEAPSDTAAQAAPEKAERIMVGPDGVTIRKVPAGEESTR